MKLDSLQRTNKTSMLNVPNILSIFRFLGSFVLVGLAVAGVRTGFTWLLAALLLSDWIDGKLAIAWKQQTSFGARIDSIADATMYAALIFGLLWLYSSVIFEQWIWIAAVIASYVLTTVTGLIKYRRIPSYHTRAAKTSWFLVSVGALTLFATERVWPLQLAAFVVVLTNLEATMMTFILKEWHADVPSIWHALMIERQGPKITEQVTAEK